VSEIHNALDVCPAGRWGKNCGVCCLFLFCDWNSFTATTYVIAECVCLSVCLSIAAALSRAVSVNHLYSEEMLYGLFEIGSLLNVVDWVGFVMGGVDLCR
jgi:hypothetical protein